MLKRWQIGKYEVGMCQALLAPSAWQPRAICKNFDILAAFLRLIMDYSMTKIIFSQGKYLKSGNQGN